MLYIAMPLQLYQRTNVNTLRRNGVARFCWLHTCKIVKKTDVPNMKLVEIIKLNYDNIKMSLMILFDTILAKITPLSVLSMSHFLSL